MAFPLRFHLRVADIRGGVMWVSASRGRAAVANPTVMICVQHMEIGLHQVQDETK